MISILYVDDETTLLEITQIYLEQTGDFTVATCSSAKEAIGILENGACDAVISDYQMPEMDGLVFLKHLRANNNAVPFILFTGKGREEVAIEALNSGADFYLQKGGEPKSQYAELASKIRQAVTRRKAEEALAESEEKYRDLVENINDVLFAVGSDGRITYISPRVNQFGYTPDDVIGRPLSAFIVADDLPGVEERFHLIENGEHSPFEFRILDGAGKPRIVRTSSRPSFTGGQFSGIHGVMTDITLVKAAEAKISAGEQRYRNVFEAAGDAMLVLDDESGTILDANCAATYLFGITRDELKGMTHANLLVSAEKPSEKDRAGITSAHTLWYRSREGVEFPADVLSSRYPRKDRIIAILSIRNITAQKQAKERMLAAQRLYAVLSRINETIVRVRDLETLVDEICRISVEYGRFRMSWVGLLDHDSGTLRPVAHAGHEDGYLAAIGISMEENELGRGPTGIALREGKYDICNDIATDPRMEPWRDEALNRGYRSSAAFPFRLHGEVVGAYMIYAAKKDFFTAPEIALLEEIALDISFALDLLDEQARRTHAEKALAGSEERAAFLSEVLELSSQPFSVGYPDGRFGIVNPAMCDLVGYTEEEMREITRQDITPDEWAVAEQAALDELVRTGIPVKYEKELIKKDHSRVPVRMFVHRVLDPNGNLSYFYAFVTDITVQNLGRDALKKERDQAQRYLDVAGVMLAVLDTEGKITLINRRGCAILGYFEEELLGRDWITTCLPHHVQDEVRGVFDQIAHGEIAPVEYHENPVIRKDGQERVLAFHNTLLLDDDARIAGILFSGEDVTVQRQAESELCRARQDWQRIFPAIGNPALILDPEYRIIEANDAVLELTGKSLDELRGMKCWQVFHAPGIVGPPKGCPFERMVTSGRFETTEMEMAAFGGTYLVSCTPVLNENGELGKVIHIATDITKRQRAERELSESEGRYRAIFEKAADAIFVMNDRFLDCNPAAEHLFGYRREEIIGQGPALLSLAEQPDGGRSGDLAADYIRAALKGTPQVFSWTHKTKNGRLFPSEVTMIPAPVRGEDRLIVIVHDRTAQDNREQQSRHLARFPERSPDPVIEIDSGQNITYANPASLIVLKTLEMPQDPAAFIPDGFDTLVAPLISAGSDSPVHCELRIGTALFGETISYDPVDKRVRIYAREVTTRSFETSALEQANRKLNLLSSITRHDIKNKLTGVLGYLELARGSTRDTELIEYLNRAETSATAIRQQIEFTKEYENLGVKTPVWQELSLVLEAAEKLLEMGAVVVEDETSGLSVYADPMLEKVLYCLLENAVKHGDTITKIRIHGSSTPAGYQLVVEDDGVGILNDRKEKIFNKNVGKGGGGFGLFLVREILSITGITVEETGTPGAGARFEISIPIGKFHVKSPE
jgi:PAS domain S-box-containing protein